MAKIVPIIKDGPGPIESNVPLRPVSRGAHVYPFSRMKPGDSFTVAKAKRISVWVSAMRFKKNKPGIVFTTRIEGDRVRIWRIK